ncbi:hypothetical protein B0H19DRAFT_1063197 [Mycena capillaripes]|nr:hypothetical protein B0H19DRAFT_1063197 [Mycena capillaripes]
MAVQSAREVNLGGKSTYLAVLCRISLTRQSRADGLAICEDEMMNTLPRVLKGNSIWVTKARSVNARHGVRNSLTLNLKFEYARNGTSDLWVKLKTTSKFSHTEYLVAAHFGYEDSKIVYEGSRSEKHQEAYSSAVGLASEICCTNKRHWSDGHGHKPSAGHAMLAVSELVKEVANARTCSLANEDDTEMSIEFLLAEIQAQTTA